MRITVIGGGPAGYAAAFEATRLGAVVTLVEKDRLGGTCLNRGCIPTKTILRSARIVADTRAAAEFGLQAEVARVDVAALRARKDAVVAELAGQLHAQAKRLGVQILHGTGHLIDATATRVLLAEGGEQRIASDAVILACGSDTLRLPGIDHALEGVWTSDEAVALTEIPAEVLVIGGGVIGLEFACAYAAFGSRVVVVELTDQLLPGIDKRVGRVAKDALGRLGIEFRLGEAVESVQRLADGRMRAALRSGEAIETDVVLSAVGRVPHSSQAGLAEAGVAVLRAAVEVDGFFRTSVPGVWAVGDLIGGMMLAHVAEEEGVAAARNAVQALRGEEPSNTVRAECIPACVYTFPEIAVVGISRDSAQAKGLDPVVGIAKFSANGKAIAEGESEGFVQLVAERTTGRVLGCQIVGPHAVEIIHEVATCMRNDGVVGDIARAVHAHPTVSEVVRHAATECASKIDGKG
ncbi:MAG: dihydrolipoyl dehydrogenase [Actinobacteria bacterium]|nr:dihydrolipoyl dehydrogenase [Actinomycetota bacterium]